MDIFRGLIGTGMRFGPRYTVVMRQETENGMTILRALVVLEKHEDAMVGEWAIFRGRPANSPGAMPPTLTTFPGRDAAYFANPFVWENIVVYQRISADEYMRRHGPTVAPDTTPDDDAAAGRGEL